MTVLLPVSGRFPVASYVFAKLMWNMDTDVDAFRPFARALDLPEDFEDFDAFIHSFLYDENNPDSILSNLNRAYDNAIVLREEIGSETLSYIQLAIYDMNKAKVSRAPLIEMQRVIDNILAFWGIADDIIDSEQIRNIIKTGKRIERIDLYARLGMSRKELEREIFRLAPRIERSYIEYDKEKINMLKKLVAEPEIDYYKIVSEVEAIL